LRCRESHSAWNSGQLLGASRTTQRHDGSCCRLDMICTVGTFSQRRSSYGMVAGCSAIPKNEEYQTHNLFNIRVCLPKIIDDGMADSMGRMALNVASGHCYVRVVLYLTHKDALYVTICFLAAYCLLLLAKIMVTLLWLFASATAATTRHGTRKSSQYRAARRKDG
jgi:hypothetical protein